MKLLRDLFLNFINEVFYKTLCYDCCLVESSWSSSLESAYSIVD